MAISARDRSTTEVSGLTTTWATGRNYGPGPPGSSQGSVRSCHDGQWPWRPEAMTPAPVGNKKCPLSRHAVAEFRASKSSRQKIAGIP